MNADYKIDHRLKKTHADLVSQVHEHDVDIHSSHIYLFGSEDYASGNAAYDYQEPGIEYVIANRLIRNLNLCMRLNPNKPILIHMKTCGGFWEEGMAIYDAIRSCPYPVTILNYSHARSMSSIIFQAANKRVMMPNSQFMFHEGTLSLGGTVKQVNTYVKFSRLFDAKMLDIYVEAIRHAEHWKQSSPAAIRTWLTNQMKAKEDVFLTAEQTVKIGFADEIFDYNWKKLTQYSSQQLQR